MLMIVRVTSRCNFKCDFCSASRLTEHQTLSVDAILRAIETYRPRSVTFEGGDPLVLPPSYYEELFSKIPKGIEIAMTTNLWNWYKNPENWDVLKRYDVHVCTSFQYGRKRKITDSRPLTEDIFVDMVERWKERMNRPLSFIAVIDKDNRDTAIKTVKLAKRHKMMCKLNPCFVSGRATESYPWDKTLEMYAEIVESGLSYWEDNSYHIAKMMLRNTNTQACPFVTDCEQSFVVLNPDGSVHHCSTDVRTNGADSSIIHFYDRDVPVVSTDCLTCPWYQYCNTCRVYRQEIRAIKTPEYCERVSNSLERIQTWANNHKDYFDD